MKAVSNAYESCSVPGILEIPGGFKSELTGLALKPCRAQPAHGRSYWALNISASRVHPEPVVHSWQSALKTRIQSVMCQEQLLYADAKIKIKVAVPNPVRPPSAMFASVADDIVHLLFRLNPTGYHIPHDILKRASQTQA